jgi:hypothetical protein
MTKWSFEADYFTACNCDWGCPCNFNARPTEGRCMGWGVSSIISGRFGTTSLDGTRLGLYYKFPGLVGEGHGVACTYIDSRTTPAQRQALEAIGTGKEGGDTLKNCFCGTPLARPAATCAFRRSRPPIPTHRDHLFRSIATSLARVREGAVGCLC